MKVKTLLISLLVGGLVVYLIKDSAFQKLNEDIADIIGVLLTLSGTLLGFIFASLSIMTAMMDKRLVQNMKKTGHYQVLLSELFYSAGTFLLVMLVTLATLFFPSGWLTYSLIVSVSLFCMAILFLVFAARKFYLVISL